jgi:hypothetical protein
MTVGRDRGFAVEARAVHFPWPQAPSQIHVDKSSLKTRWTSTPLVHLAAVEPVEVVEPQMVLPTVKRSGDESGLIAVFEHRLYQSDHQDSYRSNPAADNSDGDSLPGHFQEHGDGGKDRHHGDAGNHHARHEQVHRDR